MLNNLFCQSVLIHFSQKNASRRTINKTEHHSVLEFVPNRSEPAVVKEKEKKIGASKLSAILNVQRATEWMIWAGKYDYLVISSRCCVWLLINPSP